MSTWNLYADVERDAWDDWRQSGGPEAEAEYWADARADAERDAWEDEMEARAEWLSMRDYYDSGRAALDEMADEVEVDESEWISDEEWLSVHDEAVRLVPNTEPEPMTDDEWDAYCESVQGVGDDGEDDDDGRIG